MEPPRTSPPSEASSRFRMIDVGEKLPTRRRAVASGRIRVGAEAFQRIWENTMPKGDVLGLAEIAGVLAAKKTPDLLPLCHPLGLEKVRIHCFLEEATCSIRVECEAIATAKTGVEMEALAGASAALLSIYDLTKGINPALWISDIHLESKEGGKSGLWRHPEATQENIKPTAQPEHALHGIRAAVLTMSDRVSRGEATDQSGPVIQEFLTSAGAAVVMSEILPDDRAEIAARLRRLSAEGTMDLILTTGGTGLGPRDVTPEALRDVATRMIPGIGEALRASGARQTPMAWISRSEGALVGSTLVITFPGSPKAVKEGLEAVIPLIRHSLHIVRGGGHS